MTKTDLGFIRDWLVGFVVATILFGTPIFLVAVPFTSFDQAAKFGYSIAGAISFIIGFFFAVDRNK